MRNFADDTPFIILREDPRAEPGWVEDLAKYTRGGAPETVASTEMSLNAVVSSLSRQQVLDLVCPEAGQGFDVDAFVARGQDTIYCLSEGGADVSTAPLVTAFVDAIVSAAKRASQRQPTRRLDPILTLVLDEAPNVAPLPDMQALLTDGGGRGLHTWVFAQSFGQLRGRWGRDGADTLWGGTSLKLLLGGCTETDELERISRLCGDRWVRRDSVNRPDGWFSANQGSQHTSVERERRIPVDEISEMPIGTALLLYRSTVREKVTLPAWWERPDAARFADSLEQARQVTGRTPAPA